MLDLLNHSKEVDFYSKLIFIQWETTRDFSAWKRHVLNYILEILDWLLCDGLYGAALVIFYMSSNQN